MTTKLERSIKKTAATLKLAGWVNTAKAVEEKRWPAVLKTMPLIEEAAAKGNGGGPQEKQAWVAVQEVMQLQARAA